MPFKIGDKVRMSRIGRDRWRDTPHNPWDFPGIVIRLQPYGRYYVVQWPSTIINGYDEEHLELVTEPRDVAELVMKDFDFGSVAAYARITRGALSLENLKNLAREVINAVILISKDPVFVGPHAGFLAIKQNGKVYLTFAPFSITEGVDIEPAIPRDSGIRKLDLDD